MELMKNIIEGGKVIGKKALKPAIGLAVAAGTAVALALVGKKARQTEEPEIEDETTEETKEETTEEEIEENEDDESEEDEEA